MKLTCPHCGAGQTRLAAGVKKGMKLRCDRCRKLFEVAAIEAVIGTSRQR